MVASGLSCGMQGLCCSMQDLLLQQAGSVTLQYVGLKFPDQGLNLHPLNCKGDAQSLVHQGSPNGQLIFEKVPRPFNGGKNSFQPTVTA